MVCNRQKWYIIVRSRNTQRQPLAKYINVKTHCIHAWQRSCIDTCLFYHLALCRYMPYAMHIIIWARGSATLTCETLKCSLKLNRNKTTKFYKQRKGAKIHQKRNLVEKNTKMQKAKVVTWLSRCSTLFLAQRNRIPCSVRQSIRW